MKSEKLMQSLLADLAVHNVNIHNLHWNVEGQAFKSTHVFLQEMYEALFEKFDDVAELIKSSGVTPASSLKEYLGLSTVAEYEDTSWSIEDAFAKAKEIFEQLIDKATQIRTVASEADEFIVANLMEDYIAEWTKTLWMINASMK